MQGNKALLYAARIPVYVDAEGQAIAEGAPGVISQVTFTAAGGNGTLELYDGKDDSGDPILSIAALEDTTAAVPFPRGLLFTTGIYAVPTNGVATIVASRK